MVLLAIAGILLLGGGIARIDEGEHGGAGAVRAALLVVEHVGKAVGVADLMGDNRFGGDRAAGCHLFGEVERPGSGIVVVAQLSVDHLDGITVDYGSWWFNVRPSNTEPLLRLNVEANSRQLMEQKRDELLAFIRG